jgi:hypothetical protein
LILDGALAIQVPRKYQLYEMDSTRRTRAIPRFEEFLLAGIAGIRS